MKKTALAAVMLIFLLGFSLFCSHRSVALADGMLLSLQKCESACAAGDWKEAQSHMAEAQTLWEKAHAFTATMVRESTAREIRELMAEAKNALGAHSTEDALAALTAAAEKLKSFRESEQSDLTAVF